MTPEAPTSPPLYVIAAARNEADRVADTFDALAAAFPGARLLLADDASEDGTAEIAMQHGATVISRGKPHGKGGNVTAAAMAALDEVGEDGDATFLLCDADLGSSAAELAPLVDAVRAGECGLAVAAFAKREGGGFGFALGYAHDAIEDLCGFDAEAPISGQRAMTLACMDDVIPFADGFGMEIGMTVDAVRAGHTVKEIELPLTHRATYRTLRGFVHRARQLRDFRKAARARRT